MKRVLVSLIVSALPIYQASAQSGADTATQQAIENVQRFMQQDLKRLEEAMPAKLTAQVEERKRQEEIRKMQLAEQQRIADLHSRRKSGDYLATHELGEKAYVVNKNGTVYDPAFNITWMRCSLGQTWSGSTCAGNGMPYTWQQANQEAKNMQFAGKNDWRLPTREELSSLVYCSSGRSSDGSCSGGSGSPAILTSIFPNTASRLYWSALPGASYSSNASGVNFVSGNNKNFTSSSILRVRLVRSGQ